MKFISWNINGIRAIQGKGFMQTRLHDLMPALFCCIIDAGLINTVRHFHLETVTYSWWSFLANFWAKNIG